MNNFNRGNNKFGGDRGGERNFSRRPSFGGRRDSSSRPEMHKTTCSKCGNECEVPFRPTGAKPVFCSNCFERNNDSAPRRFERNDSRSSGRGFGNFEKNYDRGERNDRGSNTGSDDQYKKQFESLNWKLDKILKLLAPVAVPQEDILSDMNRVGKEVKIVKPKKAKNTTNIEKLVVETE